MRHNEVNRETDELGRQVGKALTSPFGRADLQREVPSLHVAQFAQPLPQFLNGDGGEQQNPYAVDFPRLLRRGGARRHQASEGEEQDNPDGAAPHSALLLSAHGLPGAPSPARAATARQPLAADQGHTAGWYAYLRRVSNHGD
jgi:hypothetical protein